VRVTFPRLNFSAAPLTGHRRFLSPPASLQ